MNNRANKTLTIALPWVIWTIACAFFFHQYAIRVSVSSLSPELAQSFHINAITLSNVAAFFFYAFCLATVPAGILIDRFGSKKMLAFAISSCMVGCLVFAFSRDLIAIEIGRIFIGIGAAFAGIATMTLTRVWFSARKFALVYGLAVMTATLGGALGGTPIADLGQKFGWRPLMLVAAVICVGLIILTLMFIRDRHSDKDNSITKIDWTKLAQAIIALLQKSQVWLISLCVAFLFIPITTFSSLWGTPFLRAEYSISTQTASIATTLAFIGFALGCPIMGWLSNRFSIRTILVTTTLCALLTMLAILYLPNPPYRYMLIMQFSIGFFTSSSYLGAVLIRRNTNKDIAASAFSIPAAVTPAITALVLPCIGWILDITWSGDMINNVAVYHLPSYHIALAIIPVSLVITILLALFIKESINRME